MASAARWGGGEVDIPAGKATGEGQLQHQREPLRPQRRAAACLPIVSFY
jgi:hypothetical protein